MTWYLAQLIPIGGGGHPEHPIYYPPVDGGSPPGIWPSPGVPTHPIAPGGPPPGIWPSPGYPAHPIAPGGPPPGIWPSPGYPAHPIAPGGPPVGIWPSPGYPAHPIAPGGPPPGIWPSPGVPTHPIVIVPPPPGTGEGAPPIAVNLPIFPWTPSHPIELPPDVAPPETPDGGLIDWKAVYTPQTGWVVVGVPNVDHPAPSA
jgi:hypothetical protein